MNNEQLESCLITLKSSSREPDLINGCLEERMMELHLSVKKRSLRTKRLTAIMTLLLVSGTGFVAMGGDSAVVNYISPSTEKDAEGNVVPHDFSMGKWLHRIHDHLWEHFHSHHSGD